MPNIGNILRNFFRVSTCIAFSHSLIALIKDINYLTSEQAKKRRLVNNDLNKSASMETTIEKRIEKSLVFQHRFGKILLYKVYTCVLCEKSNKLFCY